jgi:hypothetical protein
MEFGAGGVYVSTKKTAGTVAKSSTAPLSIFQAAARPNETSLPSKAMRIQGPEFKEEDRVKQNEKKQKQLGNLVVTTIGNSISLA